MFFKCFVIAAIASSAWGRSTGTHQNSIHHEAGRSEESSSIISDLRYVYKVYQECAATDVTSCLKLKLVAALDRAARAYSNINLIDGVSFVKDPQAKVADPKSENEIEASLPRSLNEKEDALDTMISDRVSNFFETHTLQVKLPSASELQRSFTEEGRKKKGKGGGMLILPLILGGTLIPLALGALALLAGKALIVSKLALVLAGIIGLKKLLSNNPVNSQVEVVSGAHSGWGRSYDKEEAQKLAYNAYAQKTR